MSKVHIGQKIKTVVRASGMTVAEFARLINVTRDGANKIFRKEFLDTELLAQVSKALRHDFFNDFSKSLDLANEPKDPFGFATRDDLQKVFLVLEKMNNRLSELESGLKKGTDKKTAKKYSGRKKNG